MKLLKKTMPENGCSMYLLYPEGSPRTPFKRRSIALLMDDTCEENVRAVLEKLELDVLSREKELILYVPILPGKAWDEMSFADCAALYRACEAQCNKPAPGPMETNEVGIPTLRAMMNAWHPMNDAKYVIGLGSGADVAVTLAACTPVNIAAIMADGGKLMTTVGLTDAPVPACLYHADPMTALYFRHSNGENLHERKGCYDTWASGNNPWQRTFFPDDNAVMDAQAIRDVWMWVFAPVRRTNTCIYGDVEPAMDHSFRDFELFIEDNRLGDDTPHTWFTYLPKCLREGERKQVPLVIFFHGGTDNPAEAADMSKLHELGDREGFITVYPWGTNRCSWNNAMEPEGKDDARFSGLLIDYMLKNYPVDPERVYITGFSNGAAMAQVTALLYPDKVAGLFHVDSNWPGAYGGKYLSVTEQDVTPFRLGFELKKKFDYLMPVWYTYGAREMSFPIFRACTQQNQYDLWKKYNHIAIRETPQLGQENPNGCGVEGENREMCFPSSRHPHHRYQVERFYTNDAAHLNLYNLTIMYNKGHEVAEKDLELGWNYIKHFRRLADGSLVTDEKDE